MISQATEGEAASLSWSLDFPGVLPEALRDRGTALRQRLLRPLHLEMAAIQGLFLAAVIVGIRRRNTAILVLASAVLLKYGVHGITAAHQGRYFFVATAWEILAISVAVYEIRRTVLPGAHLLAMGALGVGAACSLGLVLFAPHLAAFVRSRDPVSGSLPPKLYAANQAPVNEWPSAARASPGRQSPGF
jgi:hypothetical protein